MKILVLGDTHLGRSLYQHDLTPSILAVMDEFFDFCENIKGDVIAVHLGDLFDNPRPTLELERLALIWCKKFEQAKIPLFLMAGNHDVVSSSEVKTALSSIKESNFKSVYVVEKPKMITTKENCTDLLFVPFPSTGIYEDLDLWNVDVEKCLQRSKASKIIAFTHLNVVGAKLGKQEWLYRGGDHDIPQSLIDHKKVNRIYNGHFHKPQSTGKVLCVGSSQRLTFGEAENILNFMVLDIKDDFHTADYLPIKNILKMRELEFDLSGRNNSSKAITLDSLKQVLSCLDLEDHLVKVKTFTDEQTTVTTDQISTLIYACGASHVVCPPPIRVQGKEVAKVLKNTSISNPTLSAKTWIKDKIKDRPERVEIFKCFKTVYKKVSSDV